MSSTSKKLVWEDTYFFLPISSSSIELNAISRIFRSYLRLVLEYNSKKLLENDRLIFLSERLQNGPIVLVSSDKYAP